MGSEGGQGSLTYLFSFSDNITLLDGDSKTKDNKQTILHDEIFGGKKFHDGVGGLLGSHSNGKLASTHAMKNRYPQEEKNL